LVNGCRRYHIFYTYYRFGLWHSCVFLYSI